MKRMLMAGTMILATVLNAQAAHHHKKSHVTRNADGGVTRNRDGSVTYNRDAKDPNVGWHTEGGFRVCTSDCDNPEIPGSGATCRNVNVMGMNMRECVSH